MKIHETCECGAEFNVSTWLDENAYIAANTWREHHRCAVRKPPPTDTKHRRPTPEEVRRMFGARDPRKPYTGASAEEQP